MRAMASVLLMITLMAGCVPQYTKPNAPDKTGFYDGLWEARLVLTKKKQKKGQWVFTCEPRDLSAVITIAAGQVNFLDESELMEQPVSLIDSEGNMFYSALVGRFPVVGGIDKNMYLVMHGTFSGNQATGKVYWSTNSEGYGCAGDFIAERVR